MGREMEITQGSSSKEEKELTLGRERTKELHIENYKPKNPCGGNVLSMIQSIEWLDPGL